MLELQKNARLKEESSLQSSFNDTERIQQLERILKELLSVLHQEDQALLPELQRPAPQETSLPSSSPSTELRLALVELLSLSIQYWVKATKKSKETLAEESELWYVHLEKRGVFRARTLERYLSLKTLPKKPNLNKVVQTAEYVLYACPEVPQMKSRLESRLAQLKTYLS